MSLCRRVKLELRIRTIKKILVGEFHRGKQKRENTKSERDRVRRWCIKTPKQKYRVNIYLTCIDFHMHLQLTYLIRIGDIVNYLSNKISHRCNLLKYISTTIFIIDHTHLENICRKQRKLWNGEGVKRETNIDRDSIPLSTCQLQKYQLSTPTNVEIGISVIFLLLRKTLILGFKICVSHFSTNLI